MQKTLLFFLFQCVTIWSFAQKQTILTGRVLDQYHFPLPGADIRILPLDNYTYSDVQGNFEFLNLPTADSYMIQVSYMGYDDATFTYPSNGQSVIEVTILLKEAESLSEVVVIGDRLRGQMKAYNQQKNAANISNILSSDQVGRFPDANIGDALKRVPGITMQNDQGEARNIIIRGLAPELNSVTLNGDRIPSAEGDNRNVQMDLIPSDMIATIEVNKTLTSDMDADAIGGSVNLITRAAPNGERISATLSGGYNPIRNGALYSGGLVYGNRFFENKLGMALSGSYNRNNYGSDNVEAVWTKDDYGNVYMEEHDIRKYDVVRVRRSFSAALDYKFNATNTLNFNAIYNWRDDWENRYRLRTRGIEPIYDDVDESKIVGYEGAIRKQTKGGIDNNRVKNARLEQQTVQNYSLRGDHLIGSKLDMDWTLSYSAAREYRPHERYMEFQAGGLDFASDFGTSEMPMYRTISSPSMSDYKLRTISENTDNTTENEIGAKLNFRIPMSIIDGQKGRLRFGGRARIKNKMRENQFTEYSPVGSNMNTMADMTTVHWSGDKWNPDPKYVPGDFVTKQYLGGLDLTNPSLFEAEDAPSEYLPLNYNASENILAGYIRWDQDFSKRFSMIAGLRVENTQLNYEGNIIRDEEELDGTRSVKNDYTNVLPNLTFKYDVNDNFVLRAAMTTALARPSYYTLSPFVSTILDDNEIKAGNPALKAAYAWNYDLMSEYYFKSLGLISAGVFYKQINNFIYTFRDEFYTQSKHSTDFPDLPNPIGAGENWTLIQARNGESVSVYGFEVALHRQLDFLPGKFLKGFGIYANYTFTQSKAKGIFNVDGDMREGLMLPGTAPHMFNASLSWENKKLSARLSLNYAAAYLDELGGKDFDDRYYDKQTFVDFNVSYKINNRLRIFLEANNLTNQPLRYYQGVSSRTMQMEYYQSRFNLGVKYDLTR
jgi:TonB-dependent receptor